MKIEGFAIQENFIKKERKKERKGKEREDTDDIEKVGCELNNIIYVIKLTWHV